MLKICMALVLSLAAFTCLAPPVLANHGAAAVDTEVKIHTYRTHIMLKDGDAGFDDTCQAKSWGDAYEIFRGRYPKAYSLGNPIVDN